MVYVIFSDSVSTKIPIHSAWTCTSFKSSGVQFLEGALLTNLELIYVFIRNLVKFFVSQCYHIVDTQKPTSNDDLDDDELKEQPFCDDMEYEASQESNEKEIDEDPPWTPEETDSKYANTGDDDDTKECDKPR